MEFAKIGTLTLNTFNKEDPKAIEFVKKLCHDESIQAWFQGITIGLLNNTKKEFFNHGFLVTHNNELIGYLGISNYSEEEKAIYLRAAIDKEKRGNAYGSTLLTEITDYVFKKYPQVESIRLKIDINNKVSLKTAISCGYQWTPNEIYIKYNPYIDIKKKTI